MITAWSTNPSPALSPNRFGTWHVRYIEKATAIQGVGTLTASIHVHHHISVVASGHGELSAQAFKRAHRDANLTGNSFLWGNGYIPGLLSGALTGHGQLSGAWGDGLTATARASGTVAEAGAGHGILTGPVTNIKYSISAQLSGHGGLVGTAPIPVALLGAGQLQAGAVSESPGAATLSGRGRLTCLINDGLTAQVYPLVHLTESATGAGVLSAAARMYSINRTATLAGSGVLIAVDRMYSINRSATLAGVGVLSATATTVTTGAAAAALVGHGALSAAAFEKYARAATLPGAGVLSATRVMQFTRAATLPGAGVLTATATAKYARAATLPGAGALSAAAFAKYTSAATLPGVGVLSATATVVSTATKAKGRIISVVVTGAATR